MSKCSKISGDAKAYADMEPHLCDIVSWAEGEGEMIRNRSLLLGVAIGLFGALAVLTVRYVAVVLAG